MFASVLWVGVAVAAQGQPLTVALLHSHESSVPAAVGVHVQADFRAVLERTGTVKLQGAADTALGLEEAVKAGWKCDGAPPCLAALGRALGVAMLLQETVSGAGATPRVRVRAIDVASATQQGITEVTLPEDLGLWPAALQGAAESLPLFGGVIRFHFARTVARVTVDGKEYDAPPPHLVLGGLAAGAHAVQVTLEDLTEASTQVEVRPGVVSGVWVSMELGDLKLVAPVPPLPEVQAAPKARSNTLRRVGGWTAWSGVAAGGVACLALLVAAVSTGVGTWLLVTLPREQDSGRVLVREGQTRLWVTLVLGLGMSLWGVALASGAVALLGGVAGLGLAATSRVLTDVDQRQREEP